MIEKEIVALYTDRSLSIAAIAVETALSPTFIRQVLKEAGVFQPRKNIRFLPRNETLGKIAADIAGIYQRYRDGERLDDICANYGVSRSTVYKYLCEQGYKVSRQPGAGQRRAGTKRISAPQFVETWQASASMDEFVDATGMARAAASARAWSYRKKGIPLKNFKQQPHLDWDDLADFAEELLDDE